MTNLLNRYTRFSELYSAYLKGAMNVKQLQAFARAQQSADNTADAENFSKTSDTWLDVFLSEYDS
jgi:hypothetical protein